MTLRGVDVDLALSLILAVNVNRIVEGLIVPVFEGRHWPRRWIIYLSWIVGWFILFITGLHLFGTLLGGETFTPILLALFIGGLANFIADFFHRRRRTAG